MHPSQQPAIILPHDHSTGHHPRHRRGRSLRAPTPQTKRPQTRLHPPPPSHPPIPKHPNPPSRHLQQHQSLRQSTPHPPTNRSLGIPPRDRHPSRRHRPLRKHSARNSPLPTPIPPSQ